MINWKSEKRFTWQMESTKNSEHSMWIILLLKLSRRISSPMENHSWMSIFPTLVRSDDSVSMMQIGSDSPENNLIHSQKSVRKKELWSKDLTIHWSLRTKYLTKKRSNWPLFWLCTTSVLHMFSVCYEFQTSFTIKDFFCFISTIRGSMHSCFTYFHILLYSRRWYFFTFYPMNSSQEDHRGEVIENCIVPALK